MVWIQGAKFVTLSQVLRLWCALTDQLRGFVLSQPDQPPPPPNVRFVQTEVGNLLREKLIRSLTERFNMYLDDDNVLLATILDPRNRTLWFIKDDDRKAAIKQRLRDAVNHEVVMAGVNAAAAAQVSAVSAPAAAAGPVMNNDLFLSEPPEFDPDLKDEKRPNVPECDTYFTNRTRCPELKPPKLFTKTPEPHDNAWTLVNNDSIEMNSVLIWWKQNGVHIPTLQSLARRYLSIPATSAEPERVWSAAGLLCSSLRSRLSETSIETHLFLHRNLDLLPLP